LGVSVPTYKVEAHNCNTNFPPRWAIMYLNKNTNYTILRIANIAHWFIRQNVNDHHTAHFEGAYVTFGRVK
jgi:hypothetical protein